MKGVSRASCIVAAAVFSCVSSAASNITTQTSKVILPAEFKPPQVFENVNLVRNINLEKSYPRETINVVVRNTGSKPESQYYLPFSQIEKVGGLEVRDKNSKDNLEVEIVEYDPNSSTQFYVVHLPTALKPDAQQTLSITYFLTSSLNPLPAAIEQHGKQYIQFSYSAYAPTSYPTANQKTKVKVPGADVPDFTKFTIDSKDGIKSENKQDPKREGTVFTYGPFSGVPAGASEPVTIRYEYTSPIAEASLLERDIEVSHWGGNLATEERYWLVNNAATLKGHFNRVAWQQSAYYNPPSAALKGFTLFLAPGSTGAYYVDDIGNVTTSKLAPSKGSRPAKWDIRPRYPLFGDWKYKFKIGWDRDLGDSLRTSPQDSTRYILKVPFLEGSRMGEGTFFKKVVVRVILPEGAIIHSYGTAIPRTSILSTSTSLHRTFMDTKGRTAFTMTAMNLNDEFTERELLISYEYPSNAGLRKPLTMVVGLATVYVVAWVVGRLDVRIQAPSANKAKA